MYGRPPVFCSVDIDWPPPPGSSIDGGRRRPCIFRAPQNLPEINAYRPNKFSIGPYHYVGLQSEEMRGHKKRFAGSLLGPRGLTVEALVTTLETEERKIRECYSETFDISSWELREMMVLDGCFIIQLFNMYRYSADRTGWGDDPLLAEPWMLPFLKRDLLKLENQIPWFVLEHLYNIIPEPANSSDGSSDGSEPSPLWDLALSFFNPVLQRPTNVSKEELHLLNVLRLTYVGHIPEPDGQQDEFLNLIQPASELNRVGIKFKPTHCESFIDIHFKNGVLEISVLKLDDSLSNLLLNFIAFEQCHWDYPHVTTYALFMACLLNTPADAGFLCKCKIIEKYFGTDERIARFFSNIGKDIVFDMRKSYLRQVFIDVNKYCERDWRVHWASFKNAYFKTRWYLISAIVAFIILALTAIQSFYAVYAYY